MSLEEFVKEVRSQKSKDIKSFEEFEEVLRQTSSEKEEQVYTVSFSANV